MKKLLLIVLIVLTILVACTRPIDELIIRKVNDKNAELGAVTTVAYGTTTVKITDAETTTFLRLVFRTFGKVCIFLLSVRCGCFPQFPIVLLH